MVKLSVVVPCYNAEKTVQKCVESLINSTYNNIEIILVDDGSTDSTRALIEQFDKEFVNIHSFSKTNEGLGKTRNFGIQKSTGELITFIDSDDYIDLDAYSIMIERMLNEQSDVVYCGFKYIFNDKVLTDEFNCKALYNDKNDFLKYILNSFQRNYSGISSCTGIYKKHIINQMQQPFYSEKEFLSEDKLFNYQYIKLIDKISIVSDSFYNYVQHSFGSITKSFSEYKILAAHNLCEFMLTNEKNEDIRKLIKTDFLVNLSACFQMLLIEKKVRNKDRFKIIKKFLKNKNYINTIKEISTGALPLKFKIFRFIILIKSSVLLYSMFFIITKAKKH